MLAFASFGATPACAEFPPDGAVADPNNLAIASGIYPMPTHDGFGHKYVFYFDCGIGMWIGVAVTGSDDGQAQLLNPTGPAREFPSGPPPGSQRDAADQNRAFNKTTGEEFVYRGGSWSDSKTGALVKSPKLCSAAASAPGRPRTKDASDGGQALDEKPLFPDAYQSPFGEQASRSPQKPNKLPSRPSYVPVADYGSGTLNPSQGPIRISVPRPDGRTDILH